MLKILGLLPADRRGNRKSYLIEIVWNDAEGEIAVQRARDNGHLDAYAVPCPKTWEEDPAKPGFGGEGNGGT